MQLFADFLGNVALITLLGLAVYFVERHREQLAYFQAMSLHGLAFGLAAFLVTATPLQFANGATLDARAGPVILAGMFGGPIGATLAAALGALSRGLVGGSFAFSGVAVYLVYAALGLLVAQISWATKDRLLRFNVIVLFILASCAGAALMFFLIEPRARAVLWLQNNLPWIFAANAVSIAYTCIVCAVAISFVRQGEDFRVSAQSAFELNEQLQLTKRAAGFGSWEYDLQNGTLRWDDQSAAMHGLASGSSGGAIEHWTSHVHPDDMRATEVAFQNAIEKDTPFSTEYRVLLPNAKPRIIKGDAIVVRNDKGEALKVVGANLDLTELRTALSDLTEARTMAMEAQKFDTIGKLTGGIAHDFNNLLAVIMGNQELLKDELASGSVDPEDMSQLIDASIQATKRGAGLTKNLLSYARQAQLDPVLLDVNEQVKQTQQLLARTIESRIDLECVLHAGLWKIEADKSLLQSALINLVVNARDALAGPGKVTIETSNVRVNADYLEKHSEALPPGRYVLLAVTDNGPGIPAEVLDHIFDPFFTTKDVDQGSGLGLSMVQGFVKQSGGMVLVYSEAGVGTSFKLYFPVSGADLLQTANPDAASNVNLASQSAERILLVEDQEELLLVMERTIRAAGYDVTTAKSGDEAFEILQTDGSFDLVATDIVMPGKLQGPALAKEIRKIAPDMRFVFFSGYAREAVIHGNGLRPQDISLMKPVPNEHLLRALKSSLSS